MTTVTKTLRFDAAHILTDYAGKCRNLHGHSYRVDIAVTAELGDPAAAERDMVVDLKVLKAVVAEVVVERFDHAFLYDAGSAAERDVAAAVTRNGMRAVPLPCRSTVENLARLMFDDLKARLPGLTAVRVWETPDNSAEYRA